MAVVCLMITNTQIATGNGQLHYEMIPTSIAGCSNETTVTLKPLAGSTIPQADDGFAFYKISFMVTPLIFAFIFIQRMIRVLIFSGMGPWVH